MYNISPVRKAHQNTETTNGFTSSISKRHFAFCRSTQSNIQNGEQVRAISYFDPDPGDLLFFFSFSLFEALYRSEICRHQTLVNFTSPFFFTRVKRSTCGISFGMISLFSGQIRIFRSDSGHLH